MILKFQIILIIHNQKSIEKVEMRKFLAHVNHKFYQQLEAKAKSEAKKQKKSKRIVQAVSICKLPSCRVNKQA